MNRPRLCWRCGKLIGLDSVCPYCGAKNTGGMQYLPKVARLLRDLNTPMMLLYFCVAIFAVTLIMGILTAGPSSLLSTLLRPSSSVLQIMGVNMYAYDPSRWWTLVTALFLHIGILHLLFNLYGLHIIGSYLHRSMGSLYLWIIFMCAGLSGALLTAAAGNTAAGASGGLFGWLGAGIYLGFKTGGTSDPVFRSLMFWGALSLFFGFSMGGRIDNYGHIGGLLAGLFLTALWISFNRNEFFQRLIQWAALAFVLLVIVSYAQQIRLIFSVF